MSLFDDDDGIPADRVRRAMPAFTVLLGTLLMALPIPLAFGAMPSLALLFVIIWSSLQPRLMPVWGAFLLGLFADLVSGLPLGIWALLFPVAAISVRLADARAEGHSLVIDWLFTGLLVLGAHVLAWQFLGFTGSAAPSGPLLAQAVITILAYPLAATIAARVQRRIIEPGF
ncbi:MAG: rod shape-determining protein MreD [Sandarakinorhabdus sp.]|nr:rod shape-determining protein MreD [Sandarakinorhabdus sp.]